MTDGETPASVELWRGGVSLTDARVLCVGLGHYFDLKPNVF
jgi:hypothetical protein